MQKFFYTILVSVLLSLPALAHVGDFLSDSSVAPSYYNDAIKYLLAQSSRPTMGQFLQAMGSLPEENPFGPSSRNKYLIPTEGPRIIATLEKVFPDGIYASMGRDSVNITDLLEAYYLSVGQLGRTTRVEVSGTSFPLDRRDFVSYLKQLGLNTDPKKTPKGPFVIMDRTSFRSNSQSTQIRRLLNQYFLLRFIGPSVRHRFRMVTTHNLSQGRDEASLESVRNSNLFLGLGTAFSDFEAWHGSYGKLYTNSDTGLVTAVPGVLMPIGNRLMVLSDMYEMAKAIHSPEFIENLRRESQALHLKIAIPSSGLDSRAQNSCLSVYR